tara:strand:+ start:3075 stop:3332 length:258 start_codon:yes stop_codon:yes gene_type:complete
MIQDIITNKPRGLYTKLLLRLKEAEEEIKGCSKQDYIPFPVVFEKLCRNFCITKAECWECLFILNEFNLIEIVKFRGIKLNQEKM